MNFWDRGQTMSDSAALPAKVEREPILVSVYRQARAVPLWEQAGVTLWFLVTYVNIPGASAIRYLMVAGFLAYFLVNYRVIIAMLLRCWPLFLLPIYGAFSFIWSPYAGEAMRSGILFLMTPLILVILASRMELRIILRCFFFAGALATLYALPTYSYFSNGGPYASKNYLALHMTFAMFFALITALSTKEHTWIRLVAVPFIGICLIITLMANSATSAVFAVVGATSLIMVRFFWLSISRMRHLRSLILLTGLSLGLLGTAVVLNMPANSFMADFLDLLGKDTTFTGRTAIWDAGRLVAEDNPVFGVGLEGFWQYDVGTAQTINENDHKPFGTKLTFHNAYLEVRVHLGIIGLLLFGFIIVWCLYRTVFVWLRDPSMEHSAMLVIAIIIFVSTFTESWLWGTFNTLVNLFYLGAIATLGTSHKKLLGRLPATLDRS